MKMMLWSLCNCPLSEHIAAVCCVSYIMEKIDVVLVGAEGVVESGGIINKV